MSRGGTGSLAAVSLDAGDCEITVVLRDLSYGDLPAMMEIELEAVTVDLKGQIDVRGLLGIDEVYAMGGAQAVAALAYGATGVDYLSVGALTHSSPILDIALDLRPRA